MTTEHAQKELLTLQEIHHPHCIVCGEWNNQGLKLFFQACEDGSVEASVKCSQILQGYTGLMHGGVISTLLDGAMTNCLFAHGKAALTGELKVRFLAPVVADRTATVRAWIRTSRAPLHTMESELLQAGRVVARATAKFMEAPNACIAARNS
ncbi:MAG: PaaI family thioesterase [Kiritimatiellae bacterium]|nr:PaaI family thioesterase [Kiritimatiellia bacterium]